MLLLWFFFTSDCDAWSRRRRRRRRCTAQNCDVMSWSHWSFCTADRCGERGSQSRSRMIVSQPSCGGTACPDNLFETRQCYGSKAVDCELSYWSEWSGCTTPCGVSGTQASSRHRITTEQCGGTCSSSLRRTRSCPHPGCFNRGSLRDGACFCKEGFSGNCCQKQGKTWRCGGRGAVDCLLSSWSEWNACSTKCGVAGKQTSTRSRIISEQCGGTCPGGSHLAMTRACPQMSCWNGGTLANGVCFCKAGYHGVCCDNAEKERTSVFIVILCACFYKLIN